VKCSLCNSSALTVIYDGPIRSGDVESPFVEGYNVVECDSCHVGILLPFPQNLHDYYESEEFRLAYFKTVDEMELAKKTDWDLNDRIRKIGVENVRGKIVADFGSGMGFFLDLVKGIASQTFAIEPMLASREILEKKGHRHCQYPNQVGKESVDLAVCFDVVEHVEDPLSFLRNISMSLKKDGALYIATPNKNDILLKVHPKACQPYLFRTAHLHYFSTDSLCYALKKSGFAIAEKGGYHRYDFFNFVNWLKNEEPGGRKSLDYVDSFFEATYKNELIRMDMSSHLFIKAVKKDISV
jgi:SAM-dependent methyltransferase